MAVDGGESALRGLRGLQRAGVMIAIDDFGTGYSSFSYLRSMPATVLKLDRAFVVDIATDPDAAVITASMIHMARTLRKAVVVEGVETEEQLALLTRQGADRVQGYLISRPLAVPKFEEFMRDYVPQPRLREPLALVKPEPLAAKRGMTPRRTAKVSAPSPAPAPRETAGARRCASTRTPACRG
jgi:predicted signal transduction protein with EAL and GGDEF domain